MRQIISSIVLCGALTTIISGCQATAPTGPAQYQTNSSANKSCDFDSIDGPTYRVSDSAKPYVTNDFYFDASQPSYKQRDKALYADLVTQSFKLLEGGIISIDDEEDRKPYLSEYRYKEEEYNGVLWVRDKTFSAKLVTQSCSIYYLSGDTIKNNILQVIKRSNGTDISDDDVFNFFGANAFKELELTPTVRYDKFKKLHKVATPFYNDMMLRASIDNQTQQILLIQLYVDLKFIEKWGFIKHAIDTDGVSHELTRISTDTDCSSGITCILTETIGVTLDQDFLKSHREGFEMQVYGTSESIVKVPASLVKALEEGVKQALASANSTNTSA